MFLVKCVDNNGVMLTENDSEIPMNKILMIGMEYVVQRHYDGNYLIDTGTGHEGYFDSERFEQV